MHKAVELSSLDLRYEWYRLRDDAGEARLRASVAERGIEEPLFGVDTPADVTSFRAMTRRTALRAVEYKESTRFLVPAIAWTGAGAAFVPVRHATRQGRSDYFASVIGGTGNTSRGLYSVVVGGYNNTASGNWSTILGGQDVTAPNVLDHKP